MEINKTYLFSAIFAVTLLAGCSTTDTTDSDAAAAETAAQEAADRAAAERAAQAAAEAARLAAEREAAANLETVFYFDFDQATLSASTRAALDAQITALRNNSGVKIRLDGHADERGTREYNIALGERRANAVASYMAANGIDRSRIETVSYGEERPINNGSNESAWAQNRRVELIN